MTKTTSIRILAIALTLGLTKEAHAQGFISPFIGYDFGGNSGCLNITGCQDKKLNAGVAIGSMGSILGFEEEFGYAKNFFGDAQGLSSSVLTVMSNLMIVPAIGPVHPYVLGGLGLIKTHIDFTTSSVFTTDNNNFGWDLGGGVILLFGGHLGVRGDIRHFHSFQNLTVPVPGGGVTINGEKLNFARASAGLVVKF
jgi:opacity protein-like surface antigen